MRYIYVLEHDQQKQTAIAEESQWLVLCLCYQTVPPDQTSVNTVSHPRHCFSSSEPSKPWKFSKCRWPSVVQAAKWRHYWLRSLDCPKNNCVPVEEVPLLTSICSVILVDDDVLPWIVSGAASDSKPIYSCLQVLVPNCSVSVFRLTQFYTNNSFSFLFFCH